MGVYGKSKPNPKIVSRMMVDEYPLRPNNKTAAQNRRARKLNKAKPRGNAAKPSPSGSRVGDPWGWESLGDAHRRAIAEIERLDALPDAVHGKAYS
jgi:hypothetical protein